MVPFGLELGTSVAQVLMYLHFRFYKNKQEVKEKSVYIWPTST